MLDKFADVRAADIVDVVLVALAIYFALHWLHAHTSRGLATVGGASVALFILANYFDLYLTLHVFQTGIAVAIVVFVVVFQEDIRHAVEQFVLAARLRKPSTNSAADSFIPMLVQTVSDLARQRRGALIVLASSEPLELHLEGGVDLVGRISQPLLDSLFDPHSGGHDGAVIIENGFITRFAVHLPLSSALSSLHGRGTRHRAALGLAERSDALVIVVSEERGEISLAQSGELRIGVDTESLESTLQQHLEPRRRQQTCDLRRSLLNGLVRHPRTKLTALLLAVGAWVAVAPEQHGAVHRVFVVPVEYRNVPDYFEAKVKEASVTFSGTERAFQFLAPSSLKVSVDLKHVAGQQAVISLTEANVRHPPSLRVYHVEPSGVRITMTRPASAKTGSR